MHEAVKRQLADGILRGRWAKGATLPGETYLAQEYGVGVGTMRRALAALVTEGLLSRRRKTGTVVTGRTPNHRLGMIYQFFRLHRHGTELVESTRTILATRCRPATPEEAERLRLDGPEPVVAIHRLRSIDQRPVMHELIVVPAALLPDFPDGEDVPERVYVYMLERHGLRIAAQRELLSAQLATEDDIRLLQLGTPGAVLVITATAYDPAGVPLIALTQRAQTTDFAYVNEVQQ